MEKELPIADSVRRILLGIHEFNYALAREALPYIKDGWTVYDFCDSGQTSIYVNWLTNQPLAEPPRSDKCLSLGSLVDAVMRSWQPPDLSELPKIFGLAMTEYVNGAMLGGHFDELAVVCGRDVGYVRACCRPAQARLNED